MGYFIWSSLFQLFTVQREGEAKRFKPFKKLHNRKLLWHGSRVTNFAGILSQGLRIAPPEAPVVRIDLFLCNIKATVAMI